MANFHGRTTNGKLTIEEGRAFNEYVSAVDGPVIVRITRHRDLSSPQNRWYWGGIVAPLAVHYGMSQDEMHACLKWTFSRWESIDGLARAKGTSVMDKEEFTAYVERIREWAEKQGIKIEDPNDFI